MDRETRGKLNLVILTNARRRRNCKTSVACNWGDAGRRGYVAAEDMRLRESKIAFVGVESEEVRWLVVMVLCCRLMFI